MSVVGALPLRACEYVIVHAFPMDACGDSACNSGMGVLMEGDEIVGQGCGTVVVLLGMGM